MTNVPRPIERGADVGEVNYIVFAQQGLVTYRFAMDGGDVHEFEDLEQAIRFAKTHDVHEVGVVFPDGDVHSIPITVRGFVPDGLEG